MDLSLEVDRAKVTLLVADNGRGFDPAAAHPGHFGLQLMREHAQAIGGTVDIASAPGQGAQVRIGVRRWRP